MQTKEKCVALIDMIDLIHNCILCHTTETSSLLTCLIFCGNKSADVVDKKTLPKTTFAVVCVACKKSDLTGEELNNLC